MDHGQPVFPCGGAGSSSRRGQRITHRRVCLVTIATHGPVNAVGLASPQPPAAFDPAQSV